MGLGNTDASRTVRINFIADNQNVGSVLKDLDGQLRDVKGRFLSTGKQAELFEEQARRAGQQGAGAFRQVGLQAKAAQASLRGMAKSGRAAISSLKDVGLVGLGLSTVVDIGRQAAQVLDELATEALEVQQVSRNLAFGLDEATVATEGYVDKMTLARNANKAFSLGVAQDSTEFAALVGSASKIAQAQGVSAQKLVEQAVVGIGRKSAARLDDLGIILTQTKAERLYAKSLGKTARELTILEKEEAFQKAALIEIAKAGDRAASSVDGFAVTVAKGKVTLEDSKLELLGFDDTLGKVRESMRGMTDEELERLRFGEMADDASSAGKELNDVLELWGVSLVDVRGAADELGVSFQDLIKGQQELREVSGVESTIKGLNTLNQAQIKNLKAQSDEAEFQGQLAEAEGASQQLVNFYLEESLELRRDAAELQFAQTESVEDETRLLAAQHDLDLAVAKSTKKKGGGGGPSRGDRVLVAGEQRVAQLELMAEIAGVLAKTSEDEAEAQRRSFEAEGARLELERQSLEVTRASGKHAKAELANKLAANAAASQVLTAQGQAADQARINELISEAVTLETARAQAVSETRARVVSLDAHRVSSAAAHNEQQAAELEQGLAQTIGMQARLGLLSQASDQRALASQQRISALTREAELEAIVFAQRQTELEANPPETELERISQRDAFAALAHDRELARIQNLAQVEDVRNSERARLHQLELKRAKERVDAQKRVASVVGGLLSSGAQLGKAITDASIKDDEKRAKAQLRMNGIMAIATGALETVQAAASFASFNVVQGVMHTAAAALAFTQGGIMLSGNIPGRGSASAGGAAPSAPTQQPRETSDAQQIVGSNAGADGQPRPRPGTAAQAGQGGTVVNIGPGAVQVLGALDGESAEKIAIAVRDVGYGLEAAG